MPVFEQAILDQIAQGTVRRAALAKFEFASQTIRTWAGVGPLVTDGQTWEGVGTLVSISAVSFGPGGAAGQLSIATSGVDPRILALARGERSEVAGRYVTLYVQYFDQEWQPLGAPKARWLGLMDTLTVASTEEDGSDGAMARVRGITLTAESWASDRSRPPYGSYSDRDQRKRFPGDRGCERLSTLQKKVLKWPQPD